MSSDTTALTAYAGDSERAQRLHVIYGAWLDSKRRLSDSRHTAKKYSQTFEHYAAYLNAHGVAVDDADTARVATAAQAWASRPNARRGGDVARSTLNNRLAVISSFYRFACKRGYLQRNPIDLLEHAKVQGYAGAKPIPFPVVQARLAAIDRSTLKGARDYALLTLALFTGRRAAELAGLSYGDLQWTTIGDMSVEVIWRRTKGGKAESNVVRGAVCEALWEWLSRLDDSGTSVWYDRAPIWQSFTIHGELTGRRLSERGLSVICEKRLGTSKVHAMRHSFAHAMEEAGAKVSEIQAALGHSSLATTTRYLHALRTDENPYADKLAELYGVKGDGAQ